jgi:hypothetical protein
MLVKRQVREDQLLARRDYVALINGMSVGARNTGMARLTGHWLKANVPRDEVLSLCLNVNSQCRPPLPVEEVESVVKSILRREARA